MAHPTRRLAAVWFADVAGFTKLSATDEPLALLVMDAMRHSVRASVAAQHGTLIKFLGDGALAEFPSAEGAVEAALEAGARFKGATRPLDGGPYRLHVGIHVGDVAVASDGDIFGDGVNRAARLQTLAEPGQILVSEDVVRSVRRGLEFQFKSIGERTAKGLDEPFEVFEIEARGAVLGRLGLLERQTPAATPQPVAVAQSFARGPRAVATGIAAGIVAFVGLGIWTAMGGTSEEVIPETLPLPASDMRLPPWPEPSAIPAAAAIPAPSVVSTVSSLIAAPARTVAGTDATEPAPPQPAPNSLAAMAERADAILRNRDLTAHETLPLLRTAADAVQTGTTSDAQAHAVHGILQFAVARDAEAAEKSFQESLGSDPESGAVRRMYAQLLTSQARYQEALFQLEQAKGQGLSSAALDAARGAVLFRQGSYREAEGALDRALDRNEDALSIRLLLARAKIQQGEEEDAIDLLDEAAGSVSAWPWVTFAQLHEKEGNLTPTERERFTQAASREDAGAVGALIFLELGLIDRALEVIDRQLAVQDPDLLWLSVDPEWAALRENPQFVRRVVRVFER